MYDSPIHPYVLQASDVSSEVRTAIVDLLPVWSKCLTAAEQRNTLLPILTLLCSDDDAAVQERAVVQTAVYGNFDIAWDLFLLLFFFSHVISSIHTHAVWRALLSAIATTHSNHP